MSPSFLSLLVTLDFYLCNALVVRVTQLELQCLRGASAVGDKPLKQTVERIHSHQKIKFTPVDKP